MERFILARTAQNFPLTNQNCLKTRNVRTKRKIQFQKILKAQNAIGCGKYGFISMRGKAFPLGSVTTCHHHTPFCRLKRRPQRLLTELLKNIFCAKSKGKASARHYF